MEGNEKKPTNITQTAVHTVSEFAHVSQNVSSYRRKVPIIPIMGFKLTDHLVLVYACTTRVARRIQYYYTW